MEELEFKKKIDSIIERAYEGNVSLLNFLDESLASILEDEMKYHSMITYSKSGGIVNSDRNRYIIYPSDYNNIGFKIVVYEIIYNKKFYKMYHRAILGSLMALGIKRECIGDIVVSDSGDAYFAVTSEISPFIESELHYIGKCAIELKRYNGDVINEVKYEDKTYFLPSLRLDVVISNAYNISRSESLEMIKGELAFVNQRSCQNPSLILKENDIVSLRHKGKLRVTSIGGNSKSGRIITVLSKRI